MSLPRKIQTGNSVRGRRIYEALDHFAVVQNIRELVLKSEPEIEPNGIETLKREAFKCLAYYPACLPPTKRLAKLRRWDNYLYKNGGMADFVKEFDVVLAAEKSVRGIEDKLYEDYIEVNDEMFRDLCEGKLSINEMESASEREMSPLCASTPQRCFSTPSPLQVGTNCIIKGSLARPSFVEQLLENNDETTVLLGPNGTRVPKKALSSINWSQSGANITRKLLMEVFDRETLASHTLSGKPSPAFLGCNKPLKHQLDEAKVKDITFCLTNCLNMTEKEVRQAITTKCADENKMYRQRLQKQRMTNSM